MSLLTLKRLINTRDTEDDRIINMVDRVFKKYNRVKPSVTNSIRPLLSRPMIQGTSFIFVFLTAFIYAISYIENIQFNFTSFPFNFISVFNENGLVFVNLVNV